MLIAACTEPYEMLTVERTSDGEGGYTTVYASAGTIYAAVTHNQSAQAIVAEAQGVAATYNVTTSRDCVLRYHDIIRRLSDGAVFRITSNGADRFTPSCASLDIMQVTAERWEIT